MNCYNSTQKVKKNPMKFNKTPILYAFQKIHVVLHDTRF